MNKGFMTGFILILAILAGSTAYYATKSAVLEDHLARRDGAKVASSASPATESSPTAASASPSATLTTSPTSSPTPTASPAAIPTNLPASSRLSTLTESYTVASGDTLYPISLKYNMSLERLAEANGLVDPYPLKVGQVLAIPELNAKQNIFEVRFTTEPGRASLIQETATAGSDAWRLEPTQVAKAENSGVFGLANADDYRLASSDPSVGTAVVTATRLVGNLTKTYEISLTQPATKGSGGIWTITKVAPKAA